MITNNKEYIQSNRLVNKLKEEYRLLADKRTQKAKSLLREINIIDSEMLLYNNKKTNKN